jgi:hypothetical protein
MIVKEWTMRNQLEIKYKMYNEMDNVDHVPTYLPTHTPPTHLLLITHPPPPPHLLTYLPPTHPTPTYLLLTSYILRSTYLDYLSSYNLPITYLIIL